MLSRRGLITGLVSLVAAPAVVRYASLMPVRGDVMTIDDGPLDWSTTRDEILRDVARALGLPLRFLDGTSSELRVLTDEEVGAWRRSMGLDR